MWTPRLSSGLIIGAVLLARECAGYALVREYSGSSFFDRWDFFGNWDNLTLGASLTVTPSPSLIKVGLCTGDVWWLDREDATSQGLAYVNNAGNAIIKVDNTSNVPFNEKRNTVRITSTDFYNYGSLWILDLVHLPFGCSVRKFSFLFLFIDTG